MKDIMKADIINKDIKQHIASAAGRIPESAYGHHLLKRWVKVVYEIFDGMLQ